MSGSLSKLSINGYETISDVLATKSFDSFSLQLNPSALNVDYVVNDKKGPEDNEEAKSAIGNPTNPQTLAKAKESVSFNFILDTTGAISKSVKSITSAISSLKKITVDKISGTHSTPFVSVQWGALIFVGKVDALKIDYTLFDNAGNPLRAQISMSVSEHFDTKADSANNQSPDITRIPTIKEGDSLVSLCQEFYDDAQMFIRIAQFNNMPSFRRLIPGTILEFPPIEK
jgi:hypothetical protein